MRGLSGGAHGIECGLMKILPSPKRTVMTASILALIMIPAFLFGRSNALEVGAEAPRQSVTIETGETVDLAEAYAKGPVLVYFYPRADTPGCTKQACNLRDHFAELEEKGVKVFGVSTDSVERQAAFKEKHNLPFSLVADTERELGKAFGVGSAVPGFFSRQTFLVVDGKIAWRDLSASPASQAQDALAALGAGN